VTIYTILAELPQWRLVVQQWIASTRTLLPAISCDGWSADLRSGISGGDWGERAGPEASAPVAGPDAPQMSR